MLNTMNRRRSIGAGGLAARCVGLGLVESLVVMALLAVVTLQVLPDVSQQIRLRRLEAASQQVVNLLGLARAQSAHLTRPLRVDVEGLEPQRRCLLLHTGSAGACTGCTAEPVCRPGVQSLGQTPPLPTGVELSSSTPSLLWHPGSGTVTPTATLRLSLADGSHIQHAVNLLGRIRSCTNNPGVRTHGLC